MPVVILPGLSAMPGLAQAPTDEAMFDLLRRWSPALPRQARSSLDAARDWVATLPYPCGWYADLEEARDRLRQRRHVPPDDGPWPSCKDDDVDEMADPSPRESATADA